MEKTIDIAIIVSIVLGIGGLIALSMYLSKKRREAWTALANELGFTYQRTDDSLIDQFSEFRIFSFGGSRRTGNVIMGETGRTRSFLSDIYLAYGIKGALLRTWGGADLRPADQTFVGVEGDFTVIRVNFSLGVFRHVGSGNPDDDWIVTGGIGWGF